MEMTDEVTATEDSRFTCAFEFETHAGGPYLSEITFELDGDLISHMVFHIDSAE